LTGGRFLRDVFKKLVERVANPIRLLFDIGATVFITKYEKEILANSHYFRNFVKDMIE
jgi:hypothetical protein